MIDLTWILDPTTGQLVAEGLEVDEATALVGDLLPPGRELACARPLAGKLTPKSAGSPVITLQVARIYHGSVIEGPGRRSVVQLQGCPIRCPGCYVPETQDPAEGERLSVADVAATLLHPLGEPRDGTTILGGEPFAQPAGLLALVRLLRARGCGHILCYSGYTYEDLCHQTEKEPAIGQILTEVDMLIDGPYVAALTDGAGPWTGSANQHVLTLKDTASAPVSSRRRQRWPT